MKGWDPQRVAAAAGARLVASGAGAAGVGPERATIDSRAVQRGELFVGLVGERVDGGAFGAQALADGAWGVLVTPEHAERLAHPEQLTHPAQTSHSTQPAHPQQSATQAGVVLAHPDPLAGLQSLARAWRRELGARGAKVVAITGSTGKTSTKDILAALLARELRTASSPRNLNTEIGLPLAVLAAPADTEALVLELAMRGSGQIAELVAIAEPDVGVIVNVGPVHLELLGSLEAIAAAKAELIAGLQPGATVIVPAAEPLLDAHRRADLRTVTFGVGGDVVLDEQRGDGDRASGEGGGTVSGAGSISAADTREVVVRDGSHTMVLQPSFTQPHNLLNLLAAVAAARALGVTPAGELQVEFSALRGERILLSDGITLINDCYNANPMSMRAALDDLAASAPARRVAVLGDMLELGLEQLSFHRQIAEHATARGVELLVTVGPLAATMGAAFGGETHAVADADAAAALLPTLLHHGDTVLVKGSRGVGLERVAQTLQQRRAGGSEGVS